MEARIHDQFCRCRACKPPLVGHSAILRPSAGRVFSIFNGVTSILFPR